jgi:hypothetical protein
MYYLWQGLEIRADKSVTPNLAETLLLRSPILPVAKVTKRKNTNKQPHSVWLCARIAVGLNPKSIDFS